MCFIPRYLGCFNPILRVSGILGTVRASTIGTEKKTKSEPRLKNWVFPKSGLSYLLTTQHHHPLKTV